MLARFVPAQKTPLTFEDAAASMSRALSWVLGEMPSTGVLALALGKTALETGRWSAMWSNNWGNVKASSLYEGQFCCILLNEVLVRNGATRVIWFAPEGELTANPAKGGKLVTDPIPVPDGHPQTRMRAFATADEGALAYARFVAGGRYKKAWERLLAGDAVSYVHELKVAGYFTADEATYARTTLALQREFIAKLEARPAPETPLPPVEEVREWLSPQVLGELDAAIVDRGRDIVKENQRGALRELSGGEYDDRGDSDAPPPPEGVA